MVKHTLDERRCDALLGVPATLDHADTTRPYYRSTYVFVSRREREPQVESLADPKLAELKIGVQITGDSYAPPAVALARRSVTQNFVGFPLFGTEGEADPGRKIIDAVVDGRVDIAIVWGPPAGYFVQRATGLALTPVKPETFMGVPLTYDIAVAVRKGDEVLRRQIDRVLANEASQIHSILAAYGVPEVPR